MKRISVLVFCFVFAASVYANAPVQAPPSTVVPKPTPSLSEIEKLKIENLQLKYKQTEADIQSLQGKEADMRTQYQNLVNQIEKENPGFIVSFGADGTAALTEKLKPVETPRK